jgi:tetratricopeptide (TPR) repeat protein
MRGTDNVADFDEFARAVAAFPPTERDGKTAQVVFQESYTALDKLANKKPEFPRAMAWKGYALALSVYEGWDLPPGHPDEKLDEQARLRLAHELGSKAIGFDRYDYDLHWAMADVHLISREFLDAVAEFEQALDLNRDARHPSLFIEAASAMMQAGQFDKSEACFRRAQAPDWHHWSRGTFLYLKAGRANADREDFLNRALDDLKATRNQLGDDFYQSEIQLVLAAVHFRKTEMFAARATNAKDAGEQARFNTYAARNNAAARRAIRNYRAAFPKASAAQAVRSQSLDNAGDQAWWADAMKALLP